MKIFNALKLAGLALIVSLAFGCAGTTEDTTAASDAEAAIAAAKAANEKAKAENYEWRDTGKLIEEAEKALKEGKDADAVKLANKARRQAESAVKQKYSEINRLGFETAAPAVAPVVTAGSDSYTVAKGDSLWGISGKSDIYGNPYQWPLIYKANSDKIKDADLIYPGQNLAIEANPSSADVSAAIQHAKTRGSWSIGVVEESDKAYLAK